MSAFLHADEYHIYYNMSSFLWKVRPGRSSSSSSCKPTTEDEDEGACIHVQGA